MSDIKTAQNATLSVSRLAIRATAYAEQTTNAQRSLSSVSANDAAAGTGARTVEITYFDQDLNGPKTEIVTLNGTTPVDTVNTDICYIERLEVLEVGSAGPSTGPVRIHVSTGGAGGVIGSIATGDGRTRWSHHYIPSGHTMNLTAIKASCIGFAYLVDASVRKYSTPIGATTYATKNVTASIRVDPNSPPSAYDFSDPFQVSGPAKFELFARCDSASAANVYADYSYYE